MLEGARNRGAQCDSSAIVHGRSKKFDILLNMEEEIGEGYSREV
jgi:hypothetical protein